MGFVNTELSARIKPITGKNKTAPIIALENFCIFSTVRCRISDMGCPYAFVRVGVNFVMTSSGNVIASGAGE